MLDFSVRAQRWLTPRHVGAYIEFTCIFDETQDNYVCSPKTRGSCLFGGQGRSANFPGLRLFSMPTTHYSG
eukprot:1830904-Amphidinium_carterae.1